MRIDGKLIASQIKSGLKKKIERLQEINIIPHLAVILIGDDPSSQTYVRQKQKIGEELGVKVSLFLLDQFKTRSDLARELKNLLKKLNLDPLVHGIIIQRPLPIDISKEELDSLVVPSKDVDGFHPHSPFTPPIASAVIKILEWVYKSGKNTSVLPEAPKTPQGWQAESHDSPGVEEISKDFINWLKTNEILIIGRGETAGKPIAETLQKMGIKITVAHSKTANFKKLCLESNIIISCVGKPNVVRQDMVTSNTFLIGVGLHQENGKLLTDYDQEEIADKVAYWTPVPGGVGPVNVACLFDNLIVATI